MARTNRVKYDNTKALYHLISRTNNKAFLFAQSKMKDMMVDALRRSAEFCGVRILAYAIMSNHFHIVAEVDPTRPPVSEDELVRRVGVLKGSAAANQLRNRLKSFRSGGDDAALKLELERWYARMNGVSEFMKEFKEIVSRRYKKEQEYFGSIWSGRFKSTLIENGRYLKECIKYVIYNPIRAGIVAQVRDYRWVFTESPVENVLRQGPVPEIMLKKQPQISDGNVFGNREFVLYTISCLGDKFPAKHTGAHTTDTLRYSSHGWKLAEKIA